MSAREGLRRVTSLPQEWRRQRRLRLFAERCTAHIAEGEVLRALRSEILRIGGNGHGGRIDVDPRFRLRIDAQDLEDGRIESIIQRLNGVRYVDDILIQKPLERTLVASHQRDGQRFAWRKLTPRAPVSIRLIDGTIGFGVFADRDLAPGELVGEYAGFVTRSESIADSMYTYCYPPLGSGEEEIRLSIDARTMGNVTRFINHSEAEVVKHDYDYYNGLWHVMFTVSSPVSAGQQLLIDYGTGYWEARSQTPEPLAP
jgi:hypothetical protein